MTDLLMHKEVRVRCPECGTEQDAVEYMRADDPFPTYVHECETCGYWIMESEWDSIEKGGEHA